MHCGVYCAETPVMVQLVAQLGEGLGGRWACRPGKCWGARRLLPGARGLGLVWPRQQPRVCALCLLALSLGKSSVSPNSRGSAICDAGAVVAASLQGGSGRYSGPVLGTGAPGDCTASQPRQLCALSSVEVMQFVCSRGSILSVLFKHFLLLLERQ